MAFQTNVFRDGAWVTETVNVHAVLKSQQAAPQAPAAHEVLKPPQCGLLTQTVVESAHANSILPVRIRSADHNDIAFIGDHFVQICELRKDGRLKDIARKNDFGCRIRNACVVGSPVIPELNDEVRSDSSSSFPAFKMEDSQGGAFSFSSSRRPITDAQLPPQLLMVVLESGDNVFLFVRPRLNSRFVFVASRFSSPRHMRLGFNLAVDPSSRYMALAGPTDTFGVYELESHTQLNERYVANMPLDPIKSFRVRHVRGVIHKITFLYPRPGDDHHIILLLVIARHGRSRMVIYEWELGNDLKVVFAEEKQGHRMPLEQQMPLLLIPLTVHSAFISISADQIATCTESLHGPPRFEAINMPMSPPTINHRGHHQPLWTAWSRPFRLQSYSRNHDCIYLAREDGVVLFIESDQDDAFTSSTMMDPFPTNISSAFACLFDHSTDVLVLGSDFGPGGYWKMPPRQPSELLGALPNWAPVVDFTSTDDFTGWHQDACQDKTMVPWQETTHWKPDRLFATCESGSKGSITEYRYGLKANIGLDLEYGAGMKQAWLLPFRDSSSSAGYLLLLSMPDATAALVLPSDFSGATAPAAGLIPYDLSSTTLALASFGHLTIQITRKTMVLATPHRDISFSLQAFPSLSSSSISDACAVRDCVAVSAHTDAQFQIHVFNIHQHSLTPTRSHLIDVDGEVTCLSISADYTILAGIRKDSQTFLGCGSLRKPLESLYMLNLTNCVSDNSCVEGIESIVQVGDTALLGTRSGEVITVKIAEACVFLECKKFSMTTANVSCSYRDGATDPTILVSCGNILASICVNQGASPRHDFTKLETAYRVWPTDASKLEALSPPVHFAAAVDMPSEDGITPILMISGSRLLLAELHEEPGMVPRSIPVEGTPNRVIYCRFTQCLVAAVNRPDGPTLMFINPDTGEDVGRPTDKNKEPRACISGLGKADDRILGLAEWNYRREGNVWNFILVATKSGRLIVVATEKVAARGGGPAAFRYWTRFKKQVKEPIYSVIGYDEGVIYCSGQVIYWEMLDTKEKKLKPLKSFALASPATSLRLSNGKLLAMTNSESLVVLDNLDTDEENTRLCHADPWRRNGIDFIQIAGPKIDDTNGGITLVADRECGVTGLWVPWQTPERECEVVFEAELFSSIRKFRRGRTRPMWQQRAHAPKYGRLPATVDDADVLGVSLNGAVHQFTLLRVEAWRLLRFVQNAVLTCEVLCPFASRRQRGLEQGVGDVADVELEPQMANGLEMHVDGDILRRCLEERALERLVVKPAHVTRFFELLGDLDGGQHTAVLSAGNHAGYFGLAYDVLEYYLSQAI